MTAAREASDRARPPTVERRGRGGAAPARGNPEATCTAAVVKKLSFARSHDGGKVTWKLQLH